MATIHKRLEINAPIDAVWAKMSDIGNVHQLFEMLSDAKVDGDVRVCKTADGAELRELVVSVDEENRRVVYAITESPFGMEFHSASWQATSNGEKTTFEWYTDVKPDALAESLRGVIDSQCTGLAKALAAG